MSQATTRKHWSWEEYLDWEQCQGRKYELVDGQVHAMVGGPGDHDSICNNLRSALLARLRGGPCRVQGPDLKLRANENVRYPDALIDCGPPVQGRLLAQEPVAVFGVLSRSTAWIDQTIKLRDYDSVASIRFYVLISQDEPRVLVYRRDESGRLAAHAAQLLEGLSAFLVLTDPDVTIPLQNLFDGVEFG